MKYIKTKDHEDERGRLNFESYYEAQKNNGERCFRCNTYIVAASGRISECLDCKTLATDADEIWHPSLARCPSCKHIQQPYEYGPSDSAIGMEADNLTCEKCGHKYLIGIRTSFEYQSPEFEEINIEEGAEKELAK